jgi:hypothetical protein
MDNGTVIVLPDNKLDVFFNVDGYVLEMAGTCPDGQINCGHLHLKIDGDACNNVAAGKAYNVSGFQSPLVADLSLCPAPTRIGMHTAVLWLENNVHQAVLDVRGLPVSAAAGFRTSPPPTVTITAPKQGQTLTLPMGNTANVAFTVTNMALMAPGTCPAGNQACGHAHLKIDGEACNNVAMMKAYNNAGAASPLVANFGFCPQPKGPHNLLLYLEHDNHTPMIGATGYPVSATVTILTN